MRPGPLTLPSGRVVSCDTVLLPGTGVAWHGHAHRFQDGGGTLGGASGELTVVGENVQVRLSRFARRFEVDGEPFTEAWHLGACSCGATFASDDLRSDETRSRLAELRARAADLQARRAEEAQIVREVIEYEQRRRGRDA